MKTLSETWFYSYLSLEEAHKFLEVHPVGTFLVRFSSSKPGSFAIDFVGYGNASGSSQRYGSMPTQNSPSETKTSPQSILVESTNSGFQIKVKDRLSSFRSLQELIQAFPNILKTPLRLTIEKEKYFEHFKNMT